MECNYFILDKSGVKQPAYKHEDGTLVSSWNNLDMLLIQNEDGSIEEITHETAKELGYEQ